MRKILVLRGGALGDFIVTLPAICALRRQWPGARIELAGNALAANLAVNRAWIDAAHSQHERRWSALYASDPLPPEFNDWLSGFDLVVNYWPDPEGDLARRFPRVRSQVFVSAPAMPQGAPAAAHFLEPLRGLGVSAAENWVRLGTPAPGSFAPVAVHPGSGSPRKNWPAGRWLEVLAQTRDPVLLIAGEAEAGTWNETALRHAGLGERLDAGSLRLAAGLPLEELVQEISRSRVFIGHDSGVSHLAAACGVPCLLLFGPTDPAMWAPPAAHVHVLRQGPAMDAITVEDVQRWLALAPTLSAPA